MPVQQRSPAAAVSWPVRSGPVPPLAPFFGPRPETGFGGAAGQPADPPSFLARPEETGSYVLTGPGGTGKTQLAAAYAESLWQAGDAELLVWVSGSSRTAILAGYARAFLQASPAAAFPADEDLETIAGGFLRWLSQSTRSWLIVIDDLSDAADLAGLWPHGTMGRTILTTRLLPASISLPGQPPRLVQVGPFSRREALSFLTARLFTDTAQRNGALDLAETLGCLPIALAQAAALIADSTIDCRDYRGQFIARQRAMGISPDSGPAATVAVTWSLALDRTDQLLPSALARPMLATLALLASGGIPAAVVNSDAMRDYVGSYTPERAPATDQQIRDVLDGLAQVGLLTLDPASTTRTVHVHALVQACVRQVLPAAVRDQAAASAARAVLQAWAGPESGLQLDQAQLDQAQLDQALRDCASTLSQAAAGVMSSPDGHPLLVRAGQSLDTARLRAAAIAYWRAVTEASVTAEGPGNDHALEYMRLLAAAYETAGRMDLAIEVLAESLAEQEAALGPGHAGTLTARGQLARACLAAGRLQEAIPLHERTLAGREWVLGPDHPETLSTRSDLAAAYRAAGRLDDSIAVFRRTLVDQELILGEDHQATVATRGSLAAALHQAGRMQDAIQLYQRTLADRERILGGDHPDTITARGNLAYAYRCTGKLKDAIPLYARTLADRERVQGGDHPDTITCRANLAAAYYSARKLKDAIPLYERTLADRERVQGSDHPDTLTARGNLASAYHSAGRLVVATDLYESTLADYERVLGPDHENTLTSRANLALAYHAARRMTDAIALFRRTLTDCEQALPPGHPLTQSVRESLETASQA